MGCSGNHIFIWKNWIDEMANEWEDKKNHFERIKYKFYVKIESDDLENCYGKMIGTSVPTNNTKKRFHL